MIDFHNHILPDTDDGPKTIKESIEMLQCAYEQGITDIIQTVHFQHPKMDGKNVDYDYLTRKVVKLQNEAYKKKINVKMMTYKDWIILIKKLWLGCSFRFLLLL